MIEVNLRPGLQPQRNLVLILPTIENPNQACLPRDLNPGRPANQEAVVFIPRGFQRTSRTFEHFISHDAKNRLNAVFHCVTSCFLSLRKNGLS